uniref:Uncharacterized protein n=1 Tax=viral metagenome TaxID=1070528 RepID=A0A6H1ZH50_9ZZZZ
MTRPEFYNEDFSGQDVSGQTLTAYYEDCNFNGAIIGHAEYSDFLRCSFVGAKWASRENCQLRFSDLTDCEIPDGHDLLRCTDSIEEVIRRASQRLGGAKKTQCNHMGKWVQGYTRSWRQTVPYMFSRWGREKAHGLITEFYINHPALMACYQATVRQLEYEGIL